MLPGPENFFAAAKSILPWHDEPDSPEAKHGDPSPCFVGVIPSMHFEKAPHEPLPIAWEHGPTKAGIAIHVISPTSTAGKILQHCKDMVGTMFAN